MIPVQLARLPTKLKTHYDLSFALLLGPFKSKCYLVNPIGNRCVRFDISYVAGRPYLQQPVSSPNPLNSKRSLEVFSQLHPEVGFGFKLAGSLMYLQDQQELNRICWRSSECCRQASFEFRSLTYKFH